MNHFLRNLYFHVCKYVSLLKKQRDTYLDKRDYLLTLAFLFI